MSPHHKKKTKRKLHIKSQPKNTRTCYSCPSKIDAPNTNLFKNSFNFKYLTSTHYIQLDLCWFVVFAAVGEVPSECRKEEGGHEDIDSHGENEQVPGTGWGAVSGNAGNGAENNSLFFFAKTRQQNDK